MPHAVPATPTLSDIGPSPLQEMPQVSEQQVSQCKIALSISFVVCLRPSLPQIVVVDPADLVRWIQFSVLSGASEATTGLAVPSAFEMCDVL